VRYVRDGFFAGRQFTDVDDLNAQADDWCCGAAADRRCRIRTPSRSAKPSPRRHLTFAYGVSRSFMRANGIVIIRLYHDDEAGGVTGLCPIRMRGGRRYNWIRAPGHYLLRPLLPWAGIWKRCQMFTTNCSEWRASDVVGRPPSRRSQRPHLGIVPHASSSCGGSARPNEQPSDKAL
jgi:hypothetical protein